MKKSAETIWRDRSYVDSSSTCSDVVSKSHHSVSFSSRVKREQRTAAKAAPLNAYRRKVYEAIAAGVARYVWYPSLSVLGVVENFRGGECGVHSANAYSP